MTAILIDPEAPAKLKAARPILARDTWGDGTHAVCMMSAMVPGADDIGLCVTAGWPEWLVRLNVDLFDANVGANDELSAAYDFALGVAEAVSAPRDYDKARDLFLVSRLDTGEHSALKTLRSLEGDWSPQISAVETVAALLRRRIAGEDVAGEMDAAAAAASAAGAAPFAARDAAWAAAAAAGAAASAAKDAAWAAARAAAGAAGDASAAARAVARAAWDAARRDLITAIKAS